ncbi:MAG TPA: polysaccharide lyase, partial [Myxococcales bacterium]|nr:polysaccharide lyase [Myxococcales bacterium]
MRSLALSALLLSLATSVSASVLWKGDYETGDVSQWSGVDGLPARLTIVQSPAHQGRYALRAELHQGDVASNGTRNELRLSDSGFNEVEGNERWYAWSTLFPSDFPAPTGAWQVFTQWHHSGCCGSPPVELDVEGETIQLAHDGATVWSAPLVRGVWHDFVMHVLWSSSGSGFVELYYDGTKVLDHTAMQTLHSGEYAYLKQGLYRDASISPVGVVYHDGMVMGTSLADVAPQLAAPPPAPPAPEPDAGSPDQPVPDAGSPAPSPDPVTPPVSTAPDAGVLPVQASAVGFPSGGCSQGAGGPLALLGLVAGAFWLLRRGRRRDTGLLRGQVQADVEGVIDVHRPPLGQGRPVLPLLQ